MYLVVCSLDDFSSRDAVLTLLIVVQLFMPFFFKYRYAYTGIHFSDRTSLPILSHNLMANSIWASVWVLRSLLTNYECKNTAGYLWYIKLLGHRFI